jgi:cobalamin 5'-phosphate synthase/cobalamin synthase
VKPRDPIDAVAAALSFLTRFPVGRAAYDEQTLARSVPVFPVVGALVGLTTAAVAIGLERLMSVPIAALGAVGWQVLATGALHLDGLADTADSYGSETRARALEIMQDPATGTFGVVAIVLDLAVKAGALATLLARGEVIGAVVASWSLGSVSVLLGVALPYAGSGSGRFLREGVPWTNAVATAVVAVSLAFASLRWEAAPAVAVTAVVTLVWGWHCHRRLGGVTGDTLGALTELIHVAALLAWVAVFA